MFPAKRPLAVLLLANAASGIAAPVHAADPPKAIRACVACHTFEKGGASKIGPNLFGIAGKPAAADPAFGKYGEDFLAAAAGGLVWTDDKLDAYIADPVPFLREATGRRSVRTYMITRVRRDDDRAQIIDYLKSLRD